MKKLLIVLILLTSFLSKAPTLSQQLLDIHYEKAISYKKEKELLKRIDNIQNSDFTIKLLQEYMVLKYPEIDHDIPIRQFILETGWFKSNSFKLYNNISGMKLAYKRATTASGKKIGHAAYSHWTQSVDDYVSWLNYHKDKGRDITNYYSFLVQVNYASDVNYIKKLKNINLNRIC